MISEPRYLRIRRDLEEQIVADVYPEGACLPSEKALARRYGVSRMTVRQATDGLVMRGLVVRRQGSGVYVTRRSSLHRPLNRLRSFTEDMRAQGFDVRTVVLDQGKVRPPEDVRDRLELSSNARTVELRRLRCVERRPIAVQHAWVPLRAAPGLARLDIRGRSLYEVLAEDFAVRVHRAQRRISAGQAEPGQAELLELQPGAAVLLTEQLTVDEGNRPVEFVRSWMRADVGLWVELHR